MADKSAEKERLFNEWFTKSYDRLRGTLRRYGMLDEDNFHDTYLFVRKQVLVPGKDITDYDAYFVGCYKKAALVKMKRENRYAHPEDDFFLRCGEEAEFLSTDDLDGCERLVKDILPVVYPFDYQCVVHCLSTRRFVASGHGVRTGKGLLLCRRKPK